MKEKFIPPFRRFVLQNFPFIEHDFDALTSYQLWSKIVEYLNKVIKSQNELTAEMQQYIDYINHYFDNLDVQEEINNKLDEMAESGELADIIAGYIELRGILAYDTVASMKSADNLVAGSFAETYGFYAKGDGGGSKYKVREVTNQDTVDEMTLIALNNENLVAELVTEKNSIYTKQFGIVGDGVTEESSKLQAFFNYDTKNYHINSNNILIDADISINSNSTIIFDNGSTIKRKANNLSTYYMLNIVNKHDVVINNAHIVGDRDTHTGSAGEWGHGINIAYSYNIAINNATIEKTWGDGIYIGTSFVDEKINNIDNIVCNNCRVLDCSRNGFSVCAGSNIKIVDCYASGINRTAPKAGIDIEVEFPSGNTETLSNIEIVNFTSTLCDMGIQSHNTQSVANSIIISGHHSINDTYGYAHNLLNYPSSVIYRNATIDKIGKAGIYIIANDYTNGASLTIENIIINSATDSGTGKYAIWLLGSSTATTGNITIDNFDVKNTFGLYDPEIYFGIEWFGESPNLFNKSIVLKNIISLDGNNITSKKFYFKGNSGSYVKIVNSTIERILSGTIYLGSTIANSIIFPIDSTSTIVMQDILPDGEYTFKCNNNEDSTDHVIQFPANSVVYNGNTQVHDGSGNKYIHITSVCSKLVINKSNGVFNITENNGVNLS